jgi:hypothetical protein
MPNKRRKGQSIDFYVGILKSIGQNKEGYSDRQLSVMLAAADRLAVLDDLPRLTGDSGQPFTQPTPAADPLRESLRKQHTASQGGTNATT